MKTAFYSLNNNLDPKGRSLLYSIATSEAFNKLKEDNNVPLDLTKSQRQLQVLYLVGAQNPLSNRVRTGIIRSNTTAPANALVNGLSTQRFIAQPTFVRDLLNGTFSNSKAAPYTLTKLDDGKTSEGKDATVYQLSVSGKSIPLKHVKGATLAPELVAKAVARLPSSSLGLLEEIEIHDRHPTLLGDAPENSAGTKLVRLYSNQGNHDLDSLAENLVHETGHTLMQQDKTTLTIIRTNLAKKRDRLVPSAYATSNAKEDFAEFFLLYQLAEKKGFLGDLRIMFPARSRLLDEMLKSHGPRPLGN